MSPQLPTPPFRRIAISPPGLAGQEAFAHWAQVAAQRGAHALLLRPRSGSFAQAELATVLDALAGCGLPLLLRALEPPGPEVLGRVQGVHFASYAPHPEPATPVQGKWVGKSCHSLAELKAAAACGCSYAFLSPIYPTATHPGAPALGPGALREACRQAGLPVYALGGVAPQREAECLAAGAWGVAAIGWFA